MHNANQRMSKLYKLDLVQYHNIIYHKVWLCSVHPPRLVYPPALISQLRNIVCGYNNIALYIFRNLHRSVQCYSICDLFVVDRRTRPSQPPTAAVFTSTKPVICTCMSRRYTYMLVNSTKIYHNDRQKIQR